MIVRYDIVTSEHPDYREKLLDVCLKALARSPYPNGIPTDLNAGIAFDTQVGENFPLIWYKAVVELHGRLRPRSFESSIHNSAPGYVSIQMKLTGPMLVVVNGDVEHAACLLLWAGITKLMFVCTAELDGIAYGCILEKK